MVVVSLPNVRTSGMIAAKETVVMSLGEIFGYIASILVFATFYMKTMVVPAGYRIRQY
jgi:hypothetical protein